jgi:hypothetical protein
MSDPFDLEDDEFEDVIDVDDARELPEGSEDGDETPDVDAIRQEIDALRQEREAAKVAEANVRASLQAQAQQAELDAKEAAIDARRQAALEADDLADFKVADAELFDVRLRKHAMAQRQREEAKPSADATDNLAPAARGWLALNPEFNTDPAFKARALEANEVLSKKYKADDPKLYKELDKLLAEPTKKRQQAGQVAGVSRGNAMASKRPASQSKMTNDDLRSMRKYNMDPNNPNHRRAWAKRNAPLI